VRRVRITIASYAAVILLLLGGSGVALATSPSKTSIAADYEAQSVLLDVTQLNSAAGIFLGPAPDPVVGVWDENTLPLKPSIAVEVGELEERIAQARQGFDNQQASSGALAGGITVIGDSVTLGAASTVNALTGAYVDAAGDRQMGHAPDIIRDLKSKDMLGEYVIISLGTNTYAELMPEASAATIEAIGGGHRVIFVTPHGPGLPGRAEFIRTLGDAYPFVTIADWDKAIQGKDNLLSADGYHCSLQESRDIYAECLSQAIVEASTKPTS
jgi:hypothetical protein